MGRIASIASGGFLSIMLGTFSPAFGADAIALISSLAGKVEVQRARQEGSQAARLGEKLFADDVLYTYKNSRASLFFSDGSVITVYPNSRVALSTREMDQKKGSPVAASLSEGVMKGVRGIFSVEKKRD